MPTVARTISIIYGSTTVGGTTDYILDGDVKIKENHAYGRASVSFSFWAFGTSDATFIANTNAVETAFTTPRQKLTLKLGSATWRVWDPVAGASGNTGFWQAPSIQKVGDLGDTTRSRRYEVTIEIQTPADLSSQNGLLWATTNLETEPGGRKRVTITGVYTALTSNDARAQFNASIGTYQSTQCDALIGSGAWELVHTPQADGDVIDKNLHFTRVYREILLQQSLSALNNANIVDQEILVAVSRQAPGDSQGRKGVVRRLQEIRISYSAWVLPGVDLRSEWDSIILPWIMNHAQTVSGASQIALVSSLPEFGYDNRHVRASLLIVAPGGSDLLASSVTTSDERNEGLLTVPVWSGDRFAKNVFQGPATHTRTVTTITLRLAAPLNGLLGPAEDVSAIADGQRALGVDYKADVAGVGSGDLVLSTAKGSTTAGPSAIVSFQPTSIGPGTSGFIPLGPQLTTRTPRHVGLDEGGGGFDVIEETSILRLGYRTAA